MSGTFVSNVLGALAPPSTITISTASANGGRPRAQGERSGSHSEVPWPTKQRRRIDRIRDEKWGEFVKTINDQFEWLETYYQGCVAAAHMQQRHQLEYDEHLHEQQQQQQQHPESHHDDPTHFQTSLTSSSNFASLYATPEQRRHHNFLSTPPGRPSIFSTPLAASASLNATLFPGGRPLATPERHGRRTAKALRHPRSPFRRTTANLDATSPGSPLANQSPRRTIKVTPRRLRVDASAVSRKMAREKRVRRDLQEQFRHYQTVPIDGQETVSPEGEEEELLSHSLDDDEAAAAAAAGGRREGEPEPMEVDDDAADHLVKTPSKTQGHRQLQQHQLHHEIKTPLNDTAASADGIATTASSAKRSKSLIQSARTLETTIRSRRTEEAERTQEPYPQQQQQQPSSVKRLTPGSKARDSLGRLSPHYRALMRAGGGSETSARAEPVPGLRRGNHAPPASAGPISIVSSAIKRDSSLLDHDLTMDDGEEEPLQEEREQDGRSGGRRHAAKRARVPSFHDSTAPVRFESPEREPNSKSTRLSLEEQRVFGSGRLSRTRTTGGSGYEADLSSSTTPDMLDMVPGAAAPAAMGTASINGRSGDQDEHGTRNDGEDEEDAGYDSRMSAATVQRSSEAYRDAVRVSRIRPSLAESFEVVPTADDDDEEEGVAQEAFLKTTTAKKNATAGGVQQQQQQRSRDTLTSMASASRLGALRKPGRVVSSSSSHTALDEPIDFHDLHTDLPPPPSSTATNYLRQGRSVSSTDLLSSTVAGGGATRTGGLVSRVSNLKQGVLKRSVSAIETSSSTAATNATTSVSAGSTGTGGNTLTQFKRNIPLMLPEKRTLGQRRPMLAGTGGNGGTSTSQLMSRLLKSSQNLSSAAAAETGRLSSSVQQQQQSSSIRTSIMASAISSSSGTAMNGRSSTASNSSTSTTGQMRGTTTGSSSTLMRPTESSLARAAELQGAKRSVLGGSTTVSSSSSSLSSSTLGSTKSKMPNPFVTSTLVRPQPPKTKAIVPPQPPPQQPVQSTLLPEIGSDTEDHDHDGDDDPFPPLKTSTLTVAAAVKGTMSLSSKKGIAAGSAPISSSSSSIKVQDVAKSYKSNKEITGTMGSSFSGKNATSAASSKSKVEQTRTKTATTVASSSSTTATTTTSSSKKYPEWAQWDHLEEAMKQQRHVNPRTIFGSLPTLDIHDMFPGNDGKFRARSSSAHWGHADRLTEAEIQKYQEDMGWE